MSTGANCYFQEVTPGEWYYVLEDHYAPKNAWDWTEHASAYGPFGSQEQAYNHLDKHHANPGGYSVHPYKDGYKPSETEAELFADAKKATRSRRADPLMVMQRFGSHRRMW